MSGVLGYLGLGIRAGTVVVGVDAVRRALQAREVRCIVVAKDASQRAREKVVRLAAALVFRRSAVPARRSWVRDWGSPR